MVEAAGIIKDQRELQQHLEYILPGGMVPSQFIEQVDGLEVQLLGLLLLHLLRDIPDKMFLISEICTFSVLLILLSRSL